MKKITVSASGFTLPEILVVMVLFSLLSFSLLLNVRASSRSLKSQGLASALVEELRAARSMATQLQTDVLVAFPASNGGGACRSFRIYRGEAGFRPVRTLSFDREYDSYIFAGTWPSEDPWQTEPTIEPARLSALGAINGILFRPDGSMRTNLPRLDGSACLAVDNTMEVSAGDNGWSVLRATYSPNTVVVSPSGVVRLEKGLRQLSGDLPQTHSAPTLLTLDPLGSTSSAAPVIQSLSFSPQAATAGGVGLGKTYIAIHPVSEGGRVKDYGMATITVEASDPGGGPLTMDVQVTSSHGSTGTLASLGPVRMEFRDERWIGTVGWRPPAEANPDVRYDFEVAIANPEGGKVIATSDASVLPVLHTLNDYRLAIESSSHVIYLANVEGGELVRLTPPDILEELPVWSGDGTKLYVLARDDHGYVFVRYNADGTGREQVSRFPSDATAFSIDPAGMYLKYLHSPTTESYTVLGKDGPSTETVTTCTLSALHVSNGSHPVVMASGVDADGTWQPNVRALFQYSVVSIGSEEGPAYDELGALIEGETATYSTVGSSIAYSQLSGLGPTVGAYSVEHPTDVENASFNPYDPNFFTLWQPGGEHTPSSLSLYQYQPETRNFGTNAAVADNLELLEPSSWSANGQWLASLVKTGETSTQLRVQQVVLPPQDAPPGTEATFSEPRSIDFPQGVAQPRPTPDGQNVLYIDSRDPGEGSKLMRLPTNGAPVPVEIGTELDGVVSFAITQ